jgi:hypothetical protein
MLSISLAKPLSVLSLLCALSFISLPVSAQDKDWRPVNATDLQATSPLVESGADAEAIFWEVRVDDSSAGELALRHYVRIKLFTEKGRDDFARHDVAFTKGTRIKDFEARVTKPDGSTALVNKNDVLERDIVKANGFKVKAKTVAFPGLEVGSVIEYKYKEVIDNGAANMRLVFQREVPVRDIAYYVKPFAGDRSMAYHNFNMNIKFEKDKDGFYKAGMKNVPAFREEPTMLPEDEVKAWTYIYYVQEVPKNADEYWTNTSKRLFEVQKEILKASGDVKATATQLIQGLTSDDEKLRKLYEFTKTQIKNTTYAENVTEEDRKVAAKNKSAGDTLKNKIGTASDIDQLFGALAKGAGYDARVAFSGNRNELFFKRDVPNMSLMLGSSSIAVKVGADWQFFSPASYFIPYGMMSWIEEAQVALIPDSKELIWKNIPLTESARSLEKRSGKFKLDKDGTLVGEGRVEFSGHQSQSHKLLNRGDSATEQEERLKNYLRSQVFGTVEVESFTIENVSDPEKPFTYTFKIKVPGYATRTGRRIFFQPNVFERGSQPRFTANARKYDVYFSYPYSESDDVVIDLPAGYKLENADSPQPLKDSQGIGSHETTMSISNANQLLYGRKFSFGNGGFIRFPSGSYTAVKNLFEAFNKADIHQLTLRAEDAPVAAPVK